MKILQIITTEVLFSIFVKIEISSYKKGLTIKLIGLVLHIFLQKYRSLYKKYWLRDCPKIKSSRQKRS